MSTPKSHSEGGSLAWLICDSSVNNVTVSALDMAHSLVRVRRRHLVVDTKFSKAAQAS